MVEVTRTDRPPACRPPSRADQAARPEIAEQARRLEREAAERLRRGLAPPREIYDVVYRGLIDWTRFPDWARPSDPEMFQGCVHEG